MCKILSVSECRREKTRLEQLQQEQKMMEERNKRIKALLAKTIAEKLVWPSRRRVMYRVATTEGE